MVDETDGNQGQWRPHAKLDMESRYLKARKIEEVLRGQFSRSPMSVLEIGTGSGFIAHYFARMSSLDCQVSAVDIVDQRVIDEGYDFSLVTGLSIPYADETFDLVISNHVIEHVGQEADQLSHLREIYRLLKPEGRVYLAMPNKWRILEAHFSVPFLSWIPKRGADLLLRLLRKGNCYDCRPLSKSEFKSIASKSSIDFEDVTFEAMIITGRIENLNKFYMNYILRYRLIYKILSFFVPTFVFVGRK